MPDQFMCSICGKEHLGLVTDYAYRLPDAVWALSEEERAEKAKFTEDLCQFGERYFIRGFFPIPFIGTSDDFAWGAWVEVTWQVFQRYLELYENDGSAEPRVEGALANELPAYANSMGMPVLIQFEDPKNRPSIYLGPDNKSRLANEQRNGIDQARYHEILEAISIAKRH
ncbi:DUF2199 domain-containing protein [Aestuariivirga sp.]|uniref:DUF2199 domain-containing protein n=1 Tax=Aestuariivirga sp. TaxID=2650926 RepID=UPI0039E6C34F